ncbi:uncharacterized protein LOC122499094 isoform X1 [Leptopilina heterotoma]|uniref:uncharacterized protein LOC122499094 isoform X1 n=1 Tax=Leptopilina heterotoma TaxID=63436 RepID=UPI001CA85267|nr:uncharacterized protein LOC122499094 isoform X1 [Leptopilina heterotoma]
MFKRSGPGGGRHNNRPPKKETGSKRQSIRAWVLLKKKKNKDYDHHRSPSMYTGAGVMVSGDSPPPMTTSIPPGFDISEEMRPGKTTPTNIPLTPLKSYKTNGNVPNEDIEEAVPIVKSLPLPEPQPKIEKNCFDYDQTDGKQLVGDVEDDACFVKCLYFTQQCCECTIL